jgi:hypothetical protein
MEGYDRIAAKEKNRLINNLVRTGLFKYVLISGDIDIEVNPLKILYEWVPDIQKEKLNKDRRALCRGLIELIGRGNAQDACYLPQIFLDFSDGRQIPINHENYKELVLATMNSCSEGVYEISLIRGALEGDDFTKVFLNKINAYLEKTFLFQRGKKPKDR